MSLERRRQISVVVPTYNRRATVARTLETLFEQTLAPTEFEIIVVVDGSTDGTAEALRALRPTCRFRVIEQENRGLAGARNTGYRAAETELVLFLDDDMLCDARLVEAHVRAHEGESRIVAFGALFLSADSPKSLAAECFNREIGAFHLAHQQSSSEEWRETDCVFSNSSLRREILEEFGGFDERFRMREDLELGLRLFRAGLRPKYVSEAKAFQYYAKTSADLIRDAEAFAAADLLLARKHPDAGIPGHLSFLRNEPAWKRTLHRVAAHAPGLADAMLAPVCGLSTVLFAFPLFRRIGVRALQMRRRAHWLHRLSQLGGC